MKQARFFPLWSAALLGVTAVSLTLGKYPIGLADIAGFFGYKLFLLERVRPSDMPLLENLLLAIRLPRILAALLIGASLSVSGVAFQAMFVNPLVSPGLLGVLAGASFGAALAMVFFKSWFAVQVSAFAFGFVAVIFSVGITRLYKGNMILLLILGGVISGALFTSLLSIVKYIADPYNQLPAIVIWLMGGLSMIDKSVLAYTAIPMIVGICAITLLSGYLNALSMGDEEARALGVAVEKVRILLIFFATMISALTVVLAGMIGWVGLIIPHIARMMVGPNNKFLVPAAALVGATYLVVVDDVSRLLFNVEIPIGITTSLIGIPFFVVILGRANKGWN